MKTLDHWIQGHSQKKEIAEKYWYLEWFETKVPTLLEWRNSLPKDCNVVRRITLRGGPEIVVCGKLYHQQATKEPFYDLSEIEKRDDYREFTNEPLLKSHLQKCVRRQEDTRAVLSAFHLMRLDFLSFCRRFPIIAVEDANLHVGLAVIIWFMSANPIKYLSVVHVRYFLGLVLNITNAKQYDRARDEGGNNLKQYEFNTNEFWEKCQILPCPNLKNLLLSLVVRKSFGGMKGDMAMLASTCEKWLGIGAICPYMETPCRQVKIRTYLSIHDCLLEGVDFHCFPNLINRLQQRHTHLTTSQIKSALWIMSSSINYRLSKGNSRGCPETRANFKLIKPDYYQMARQLLITCA